MWRPLPLCRALGIWVLSVLVLSFIKLTIAHRDNYFDFCNPTENHILKKAPRWCSWLSRFVYTEEVIGSNPVQGFYFCRCTSQIYISDSLTCTCNVPIPTRARDAAPTMDPFQKPPTRARRGALFFKSGNRVHRRGGSRLSWRQRSQRSMYAPSGCSTWHPASSPKCWPHTRYAASQVQRQRWRVCHG